MGFGEIVDVLHTRQGTANMTSLTGVILAGGLNSRFGGRNKALVPVGGRPILDHILDAFQGLFSQILLVTNDPPAYLPWDLAIVTDIFTKRSALTGLHAGLFYADTEAIFVTACDTPFIRPELIRLVTAAMDPGKDVVVPSTAAGLQPLFAAYSRRCLKPVERLLATDDLKIHHLFDKVRVNYLPEDQLRQADPELVSFTNINRPEELVLAEKQVPGQSATTGNLDAYD